MDLKLLNEAFDNFTKASKSLESYYASLQEKIRSLTEEVQKKNSALESALKEVERNRDFLNAIIQSMEEAMVVIDPQERIIMINHSAEELFGVRAEEVLGRGLSEMDFSINREGPEAVLYSNGKRRNIILSSAPVVSDGDLIGEVIIIKDITRLRELEMQHERNQRLIAMGEMAARIVHEIRNPLCSIELFATMLEHEILSEKGKDLSRGITSGIRTLNNILTNILIFARPERVNLKPITFRDLLRSVLEIIDPILRSSNVQIDVTDKDPLLMADGDLLRQALLNLFINAIQAMPEGGNISVDLKEDGGYTSFIIKDTGTGIEPEIIDRIFDPFFTTKPTGTGLGLTITARIVQAHGGFINVESRPGEGTTFILSIPSLLSDEVSQGVTVTSPPTVTSPLKEMTS